MFNKYNFLAMPVVDQEHRLVGIVTIDDAMTVMEAEATEDMEKMAAIMPSDKPYLKTGVLETFKAREPWLMILMLSATFTGLIMTHFENALVACTILTSFTPMLSGTAATPARRLPPPSSARCLWAKCVSATRSALSGKKRGWPCCAA